jgi:hypothetical protein
VENRKRRLCKSRLTSITIPASTQEIDGSAFVGCPLETIRVAPGSQNFIVEGDLLLTANGTEIVRYFGRELKIVVPMEVEVLGNRVLKIEQIAFEEGSKLRKICRSALSNCCLLKSISIPVPVEEIDNAAFNYCAELESCEIPEGSIVSRIGNESFSGCQSLKSFYIPTNVTIIGEKGFAICTGLESFVITKNARLRRIGREAFSECRVLGSFHIPDSLEEICEDCFGKFCSLDRFVFGSGESFQRFITDSTLDEALEKVGFGEMYIFFGFEIEDCGLHFEFPGWSSIPDDNSRLILVLYLP